MPGYVERGGLVVPETVLTAAERRDEITTCPAASLIDKDGATHVFCGVARELLNLGQNPIITGAWCCGDGLHAHPDHGCPTWLGREGKLVEHAEQMQQRKQDRITAEQIKRGARVNDRGVDEPDRPMIFADPYAP